MDGLQNMILPRLDLEYVNGGGYVGPCMLYPVVKGDDLRAIARRYGTTVAMLTQLNHLKSARIFVGQVLLVPVITDP